jgi:serine/threonine-protein kinase
MSVGARTCPSCSHQAKPQDAFCAQCGFPLGQLKASPDSDPLVGRTLPGGYRIVEGLAEGSMGRVYRAEQKALGRAVAVKVMNPGLVSNADLVERFRIEARAASSLNHPNCVRVYDFGETQDGRPYIVMELLNGHDLADILGQAQLMPVTRALDITLQILGALEEAHGQGVVHRDLKPGNIFVMTQRGGGDLVKVVDFGLAKLKTSMSSPSGLVFGTPEYISPEQATAKPTDNRTDLYACGVILFEMLSGRLPFEDETAQGLLEKHVYAKPPQPSDFVASVSDLDPVVAKALEKAPEDRYESAEAFAEALREVVAHRTGERSYSERRSWVRTMLKPCASCGNLILPSARFCGECGEAAPRDSLTGSIRPSVPPPPAAPTGTSGSTRAAGEAATQPVVQPRPPGPTISARREIEVAIREAEAAGDAQSALIFLDQIATTRLAAKDPSSAIDALKRGIEIARRDLDKGELDDPIHAVAMLTGKLGDAYLEAGLPMEARSALKDSLALTRGAAERAKLWMSLARVARSEGHDEDATEYLDAAERETSARRNSEPPSRSTRRKTGSNSK